MNDTLVSLRLGSILELKIILILNILMIKKWQRYSRPRGTLSLSRMFDFYIEKTSFPNRLKQEDITPVYKKR